MDKLSIVILSYAGLMILGGIIGYTKAKSKASLISGTVSGLALIGCRQLMASGTAFAYWIAVGIAALLVIVFIMRFMKTKSFMPSGMMAVISVAAVVLMLLYK